jgi:ATP-dependent Clp protease adaptor protein ClpS
MMDEEAKEEVIEQEDEGGAATATQKRPAPTKRDPGKLPPYKVLLHNDDKNTFDHVIRSVMRLTPLGEDDAVVKAIEAHETGVSLLLVTHRERGELYAEQFASLSITVSVEPDCE